MNEQAPHDLAAPYALDALDAGERQEFEAHLAGCAACRAEVAALQESAVTLADRPLTPPPELRDRILDAAAETDQDRDVVSLAARRPVRARVYAAVGAVAALVAGFALIAGLASSRPSVDDILAAPDVVSVELAATDAYDGDAVAATVSFSPAEEAAVVTFAGLAAVGDDETYELWVVDGAGPQPAGLFRPAADGSAQALVDGDVIAGVTIAVTREPAGGVESPTGAILFAGSL